MAGIFEPDPAIRRQALYSSFLNMVPGLLMAGARTPDPSMGARGFGMALQGFNQGGQQYMDNWRNMQALGFATRKAEREEADAETQRNAREQLMGGAQNGINWNPMEQTDPRYKGTVATAFPGAAADLYKPKEPSAPIRGRPGDKFFGQDGAELFNVPPLPEKPPAPSELDKLFDAAGIPPGDPRRAELATDILKRRGQPPQTNVNMPPLEGAYAQKRGALQADAVNNIQVQGTRARQVLPQISALRTVLGEVKNTGEARPLLTRLASVAKSFGIDPEPFLQQPGAAEAARGLSARIVYDSLGSLGTGISNPDREFILQSIPGIAQSEESNEIMLDILERTFKRQEEVAAEARAYEKAGGNPLYIEDHLAEKFRDKPLFGDDFKQKVGNAGSKWAEVPNVDPSLHPEGSTARNPKNGAMWVVKDGKWQPMR